MIQRTLSLLMASNRALCSHPSLLVFPIVSTIAVLLTFVFITIPIIFGGVVFLEVTNTLPAVAEDEVFLFTPWQLVLISAVAFLAVSFISILFSATMFIAAESALNGEKPSLRRSLNFAWTKRKNIFKWTIFSATVGHLIQLAHERLAWLGIFANIGAVLAGLAWTFAVWFVIPILIKHDVGPIEAIKRSTALLKRTWGEQVTVTTSFSLLSLLVTTIFVVLPGIALIVLVDNGALSLIPAIAIGAVLLVVFLAIVFYSSALNSIFLAALYRYAETGDYIGPFTPEMIKGAFRPTAVKK